MKNQKNLRFMKIYFSLIFLLPMYLSMSKQRKPNNHYWNKAQDDALELYLKTEDMDERNRLYVSYLYEPLKMICEVWVNKLCTRGEYDDIKQECLSFVTSKLSHIDFTKKNTAFSYLNITAKNFCIITNQKLYTNEKTHLPIHLPIGDKQETLEDVLTDYKDTSRVLDGSLDDLEAIRQKIIDYWDPQTLRHHLATYKLSKEKRYNIYIMLSKALLILGSTKIKPNRHKKVYKLKNGNWRYTNNLLRSMHYLRSHALKCL